ncbi:MAG: hypothetical protein Q8M16_11680 [Pirellulaceae bacterium]|nr:hypothetical protein [Pirellulaceae bacterium]
MNTHKFIDLNRHFAVISKDQPLDESMDYRSCVGFGNSLTWIELLQKKRVILLAEAGAGKTQEMLAVCRNLRQSGKSSFFIRLEHLAANLEAAFDVGDITEFRAWMTSDSNAWIFLDSVDEARLNGPNDFELAIRKFANNLSSHRSRCHIYVSSRASEWRPIVDYSLIRERLAFPRIQRQENPTQDNEQPSLGCASKDQVIAQSPNEFELVDPEIVKLCSLNQLQIAKFCDETGIKDRDEFLKQVERHDAMLFASRPQDLIELIEFWESNFRIGSRFELIEHSINKRLEEVDPARAQKQSLQLAKAKKGAMELAAASTFTKLSRIRILESNRKDSISADQVLEMWNASETAALLERPIFDPAIYGTVRFHHRVVREFLTAKWILERLKRNEKRASIEHLIFKRQYGCDVVVPTMRSIISWIALEDDKILDRALRISPDVLVEFGDPSRLPMPARIQILRAYCKQQKEEHHRRWSIEQAALLRFSHVELVPTIRNLLIEYRNCRDVLDTLLLFILHGEFKSLHLEVLSICEDDSIDRYSRMLAIRALATIGTVEDKRTCVSKIMSSGLAPVPDVIAELLESFGFRLFTPERLGETLERLPCSSGHQNTRLVSAIEKYLNSLTPEQILTILQRINGLLDIERHNNDRCSVSIDYGWLAEPAAKAVETLVRSHHVLALTEDVATSLDLIKTFDHYGGGVRLKHDLDELVPQFVALNRILFWREVAKLRLDGEKEGKKIEYWWQCRRSKSFWSLENTSFDECLHDVLAKVDQDDRLIALSLAFTIYRQNGRPKKWYRELKKLVIDSPVLVNRLHQFFHPEPKSSESKRLDRMEAGFNRNRKAHEASEVKRHADWQAYLKKNTARLKDVSLASDGSVWNAQLYLLDEMRKIDDRISHWGHANWRDLIPNHGQIVAQAFRDGLVAYWRQYKPKVRSEGVENPNSVPYAISIALSGIEIEFRETENWPRGLSVEEAELAARLALWEMNGFPEWLKQLHQGFPEIVRRVVLQEIRWEFTSETIGEQSAYVINDTKWSGQWIYDDIAKDLLTMLVETESYRLSTLSDLLWIIVRSGSASSDEISRTAKLKFKNALDVKQKAVWSACWIDVDAESAIIEISKYVGITSQEEADNFVVEVLSELLGDSGTGVSCHRMNFKSAESLGKFYALARAHVRYKDDIERAGKEAYSPTRRDDAQRARSSLFNLLAEIPGKATYICLMDLANNHCSSQERDWVLRSARQRAVADSDLMAWGVEEFLSFSAISEHVPRNNFELFDLIVSRIGDLKFDLEDGDSSIAGILLNVARETDHRIYIGGWLRDRANGKYSIPQEEELADAKRPDFRIHLAAIDAPVPVELKIADNWTGSVLFERLENQLCGDYLRAQNSMCGVFLLLYRGQKKHWRRSPSKKLDFNELLVELQYFVDDQIANKPGIKAVKVIGIDLTKRTR